MRIFLGILIMFFAICAFAFGVVAYYLPTYLLVHEPAFLKTPLGASLTLWATVYGQGEIGGILCIIIFFFGLHILLSPKPKE